MFVLIQIAVSKSRYFCDIWIFACRSPMSQFRVLITSKHTGNFWGMSMVSVKLLGLLTSWFSKTNFCPFLLFLFCDFCPPQFSSRSNLFLLMKFHSCSCFFIECYCTYAMPFLGALIKMNLGIYPLMYSERVKWQAVYSRSFIIFHQLVAICTHKIDKLLTLLIFFVTGLEYISMSFYFIAHQVNDYCFAQFKPMKSIFDEG